MKNRSNFSRSLVTLFLNHFIKPAKVLNFFLAVFWTLTVLGSPGVADFGNCLIAATGKRQENVLK